MGLYPAPATEGPAQGPFPCGKRGGHVRVLKIRTSGGMIALNREEAVELRERLRRVRAAQPASETIAVSANASTSVTFTSSEKIAVLELAVLLDERQDRG